ncbi:helix-turn-helix transcriptional regulator [Bacillaceae bacterium Marseille-Q3522]|nr:helix-turn-helix transcriptional regulator [Bacillaceae bacterium Marseille-Q3522]
MNKEMIKFLRKSYHLTQRDFAKLVNCSFALLALVEVGKRRVSANLEKKIKETFNLDDREIESLTTLLSEISKGVPFM